MPPSIRIPKDIFCRLQQDTQPWPRQSILFGVKEECIDLGQVVYIKGFVPYRSDTQDLDATVAQWMNHNGMTVVGFFAAPSADLFDDCQSEEIASCYFETLQASIIRSVASTIAYQSANSAAPVDASAALVPLCHRLFQSLVGLVISTHRPLSISQNSNPQTPLISNLLPSIAPGAVVVTAFVCAPSRRDVYTFVRDELLDDRGQLANEGKGSPEFQTTDTSLKEDDVVVDMEEDTKMVDEGSADIPPPRTPMMQEVQSAEESDDDNEHYKTISSRILAKQRLRPLPFQHNYEIISGSTSSYLYSAMNSSSLSMSTTQDSLHLLDDALYAEEEISATRQRIARIQKAIDSSIKDMATRVDQIYAPACTETDQLISILKVLDGREVGEWARIVIVAMDNEVQANQEFPLGDNEIKTEAAERPIENHSPKAEEHGATNGSLSHLMNTSVEAEHTLPE